MVENINTTNISTAKLTKKLAFMLIDGQAESPLFQVYLLEAKKRLGLVK